MLTLIKFLVAVALAALGIAFAIANSAPVKIDLGLMVPELPLSLLLLLAVGLGLLLGALVSSLRMMRINKENASLRRQTKKAEREAKNLRSVSLNTH